MGGGWGGGWGGPARARWEDAVLTPGETPSFKTRPRSAQPSCLLFAHLALPAAPLVLVHADLLLLCALRPGGHQGWAGGRAHRARWLLPVLWEPERHPGRRRPQAVGQLRLPAGKALRAVRGWARHSSLQPSRGRHSYCRCLQAQEWNGRLTLFLSAILSPRLLHCLPPPPHPPSHPPTSTPTPPPPPPHLPCSPW